MIFFSSQCTIRCRRYYPASFCPSRSRYGTFSETHKTSYSRRQHRQQRSGTSRCTKIDTVISIDFVFELLHAWFAFSVETRIDGFGAAFVDKGMKAKVRHLIVVAVFQATKEAFAFMRDFLVEVVAANTKTAHVVVFVATVVPPFKTRQSKVRHLIDSLAIGDHIEAANRDVSLFDGFQNIPNCRDIQRNLSTAENDIADTSAFLKAVKKSIY